MYLLDKNYEMFSKSDLRFMETTYKLVFKEFSYKPPLTVNQFLSNTFLEHKINFSNELIE
jgi:centrosomal protein CEP44